MRQMSAKTNRSRSVSRLTKKIHIGNIMFLLPTFILFTFVVLAPFIQGIPYSFTNWKSIVSTNYSFNKLANYEYLLKNKYFLMSLGVTFKFTILFILSSNIMGFFLALLLRQTSRFNNFSRTVFFLPFTVSVTAAAIVWSYVFTDIYGTITGLVSPLGLESQIVYAMVIIASWRDMGYTMLIYIAAMQTIPKDFYEAASIEGANAFQQFRRITLPMIVPAFTANITITLAWGLRTFDLPMVVSTTKRAGQTTAVYVYQSIFANNNAGLGQAAAIILTIILVVLTQIVSYTLRRIEVEL
ncbi:MAG: carbohydrate ABC transporter permease [Christensenellales bacterium]|jgi:raffinose/stachyose/melibiose transport system permease protein